MTRDTSLVYAEIAQSLIGMASNFTLEDQRSFWECRYNSAEEMVAEHLAGKGEDAIGNAIRSEFGVESIDENKMFSEDRETIPHTRAPHHVTLTARIDASVWLKKVA